MNKRVTYFQLRNGLQVLVYPYPVVPWVSTQLWYKVGSKHEHDGIRGAAHLLEHMLFKGTKRMSELDVTAITDALSGYTNAFTSHDYTTYIFDFPQSHWTVALDMLADCMSHATIKPDLLDAELAAVMQELRLYADDYESMLHEKLTADIFSGHPYHYPVIGYRGDLWKMTAESLLDFYKKWYVPNNAILVIVGDVSIEEARHQAEYFFASIPAKELPVLQKNIWVPGIESHCVDMKYDIHQLYDITTFVIPGFKEGRHELVVVLGKLLADGTSSRLFKKLVRGSQKAVSVESDVAHLAEYDLFSIQVQHEHESDRQAIRQIIQQEIQELTSQGPTQAELARAYAMNCMEYQELFENIQDLATAIGHGFISTGDVQYGLRPPSNYELLASEIKGYLSRWCRSSVAHYGSLGVMTRADRRVWGLHQKEKDMLDAAYLATRQRHSVLEPLQYAHQITAVNSDMFYFPTYDQHELAHQGTLITCVTKTNQILVITITFPISFYFEPEGKGGIAEVTARLLIDSIKGLSSDEFADDLESRGMSLEAGAGFIALTLLRDDWEYGLQILAQIIAHPSLHEDSFDRIRMHCIAELDALYDDTYLCIDHYARQAVYGNNPYGRMPLGNKKSLMALTLADIQAWYRYAYTVYKSTIAVVGDYHEKQMISRIRALWHTLPSGLSVLPILPALTIATDPLHHYTMPRDQTAVCYAGLSVSCTNEWYDALLLLDHILCGGESGSMYSLLFQIREQTGLFYTIQGSTLFCAGMYPGIVRIKMLISPARIGKVDQEIKNTLQKLPLHITRESLSKARYGIMGSRLQMRLSNRELAEFFTVLSRCGFSPQYALQLPERLAVLSVDTVREAAQQFLNPHTLIRVTVGR